MTQTASNNFITEFDSLVKHDAQQTNPRLPVFCRIRRGNALTFTFNRMSTMLMQEHTGTDDLLFQNVNQDNVTVNVKDYVGYTLSSEFDLDKLSYDERRELAMAAKMAYSDHVDQLIINELDAGKSATISRGGDASTWLLDDFVSLVNDIRQQAIPGTNLYYVCSYTTFGKMQQVAEVASSDFTSQKPLESGIMGTYMGVNIIPVPDLVTDIGNGLPFDSGTNVRTNFIVQGGPTGAIGWATSRELTPRIEWLPTKDAWKVGLKYSAAPKAIGSLTTGREGIYAHFVDEAA